VSTGATDTRIDSLLFDVPPAATDAALLKQHRLKSMSSGQTPHR
jgi:hypothetical protein